MADPLKLLRQYVTSSQDIIERENEIIFGESSCPKYVETKWVIYNKDKSIKDYYTLESLLFFVRKYDMPHPDYCRLAEASNIPAVRRPDRKNLLTYLFGQTDSSPSIDTGLSEVLKHGKRPHGQDNTEVSAKKRHVEHSNSKSQAKKDKKKKRKNKKNGLQ